MELCLKSPKSFLDTVSTGSGSDLVSDQHAIFPNDSLLLSFDQVLYWLCPSVVSCFGGKADLWICRVRPPKTLRLPAFLFPIESRGRLPAGHDLIRFDGVLQLDAFIRNVIDDLKNKQTSLVAFIQQNCVNVMPFNLRCFHKL